MCTYTYAYIFQKIYHYMCVWIVYGFIFSWQVSDISFLEMRRAFDTLDSMKEGRLRVKDVDLVLQVYKYYINWYDILYYVEYVNDFLDAYDVCEFRMWILFSRYIDIIYKLMWDVILCESYVFIYRYNSTFASLECGSRSGGILILCTLIWYNILCKSYICINTYDVCESRVRILFSRYIDIIWFDMIY